MVVGSGIRPLDAPVLIVAQRLGAVAATIVFAWLLAPRPGVEVAEQAAEQAGPH